MNIIKFIWNLLKGPAGWIAAGAAAAFAFVSFKAKMIVAACLAIAIVLWIFVLPSGGQKGLKQFNQPTVGFFDSFWKTKKTVEILIDGALKDTIVTPPSIQVKAGQIIAIEMKGMILQKFKIYGYPESINPAEVVKITIPGWEGEYRLADQKVTEFEVKEDGELRFGIKYFYVSPSTFHTGVQKGDWFDIAPLKLRIIFLKKLTGKGSPPRKIEEIKEKIPKLPGIPGLPELEWDKVAPDTEKIKKQLQEIEEGTSKYWRENPDGIAIQKKMKTVQKIAGEAEDLVIKETEGLQGKTQQWLEKKKNEEPDKLSKTVKELKNIQQKIR